jgi:hypothetical protein
MDSFLAPTLSLPTQLEMELDKRTAARMSRDQLVAKTQELIESWYMQHQMINEMLGAIRQLQVQVALAGPPVPAKRGPDPEHYVMARQVMAKLVEDGLMVPPPVEAQP